MTTAVILSETQAHTLTERIRKAGEDFSALLLTAHDGEAWRVLGYATWQDYVAGEFTFTVRRSFQLLDQARISRIVGEPVTAREAAKVKRVSLINSSPEPASEVMRAALAEQQASAAIPKPTSRGHALRGLDGLIASVRSLDERLGLLADERTDDDTLPPDLARVLTRLAATIEGLAS